VADGPFDLTGKVAVVTGGTAGIGLAMATALAQAGASVCVWGRSAERCADAVASLDGSGVLVSSRAVDVTDEGGVVEAMRSTVEEHGRLDACFANAAGLGAQSASFVDSTTAEFRSTIELVLDSVYVTMREAARVLVAQGEGGSLVATSSIAADYGSARGNHAYASGKAAVITLMKGLSMELARHRIRANTIVPGWVDAGFMDGMDQLPKLAERVQQRLPMRRWGEPAELGPVAVYLAGDGSTWHTGDELVLDGGYHAV
jgi:NAD(P)-dependent dehydrogenase (short-subunit alcohol dehydrogenase family)